MDIFEVESVCSILRNILCNAFDLMPGVSPAGVFCKPWFDINGSEVRFDTLIGVEPHVDITIHLFGFISFQSRFFLPLLKLMIPWTLLLADILGVLHGFGFLYFSVVI